MESLVAHLGIEALENVPAGRAELGESGVQCVGVLHLRLPMLGRWDDSGSYHHRATSEIAPSRDVPPTRRPLLCGLWACSSDLSTSLRSGRRGLCAGWSHTTP